MNEQASPLDERVIELRQAFDAGFVAARQDDRHEPLQLLVIEAGHQPWGVPLSELSGFHPLPPVEPLPGPVPGLLGLVGLRGQILPVYRLADLLATPGEPADCRWLLLARSDEPVGFAVEALLGHLRPDRRRVVPVTSPRPDAPVQTMLRRPQGPLPIVALAALAVRLRQGFGEHSQRSAA